MSILDIIKVFLGAIVGLVLFFGLSIVLLQLDILLNLQRGQKMIINKNKEGAWRISDIINGYWITEVYYFYTRKNAIKLFKQQH